jgi:phospholipid/cholesterol/gamma-HCH transport system permease protein
MSSLEERGSSWRRGLGRAGRRPRRFLGRLGSLAWLGLECLRALAGLRRPQVGVLYQTVRNQVRFTAFEALPLVTLAGLLLGGVTLLQVVGQLSAYGGEEYLSRLMALLVVRELGPLLVAVLVVGRSGTAIAAEMATMKLDREIDSLYATGVDPVSYLLVPRLLGCVVSLLVLIVAFDLVALFGGFVVASWEFPLSFRLYLNALGAAIGPRELAGGFLKAVAFGTAIPLISAHSGLRIHGSSTEIPQAVTRAAVESIVAILLSSTFLSVVCYG